jgi:hypothetical protein
MIRKTQQKHIRAMSDIAATLPLKNSNHLQWPEVRIASEVWRLRTSSTNVLFKGAFIPSLAQTGRQKRRNRCSETGRSGLLDPKKRSFHKIGAPLNHPFIDGSFLTKTIPFWGIPMDDMDGNLQKLCRPKGRPLN